MSTTMAPTGELRPVAYVTMQDAEPRSRIVSLLEGVGWTVIQRPTGFHLLQAIADVIDGDQGWLDPSLIVIDAISRGTAGTTIAAGLRELGITIPIVLIAAPGARLPISVDPLLRVSDSASAETVVRELAMRACERAPSDLARHQEGGSNATFPNFADCSGSGGGAHECGSQAVQ